MLEPSVIVDENAQENGLAVMLADLIRQNMEQHPEKAIFFNLLKAVVAITAKDAEVELTMFFNRGSCIFYDGIVGKPDLHVVADSEDILGLSTLPMMMFMPYLLNRASVELLKKVVLGNLKIEGLPFHPITFWLLCNVFSVK